MDQISALEENYKQQIQLISSKLDIKDKVAEMLIENTTIKSTSRENEERPHYTSRGK